MSLIALAFMLTVWTLIIGSSIYTLAQVMKHSKEDNK